MTDQTQSARNCQASDNKRPASSRVEYRLSLGGFLAVSDIYRTVTMPENGFVIESKMGGHNHGYRPDERDNWSLEFLWCLEGGAWSFRLGQLSLFVHPISNSSGPKSTSAFRPPAKAFDGCSGSLW